MSNKYLEFISDKDLMKCIEGIHKTYLKVKEESTIKDFYKNKVDPIKFNFDMLFNDINEIKLINDEIMRQKEKTISGAIGTFHENLLGCINGVTNMPVGYGYDIKNDDETIFAELKNKFNTVKGEDLKSIHKKLASIADDNPNATCYFVHIIAKKSCDKIWSFSSKNKRYEHDRVRIASADKFYEILTGDKDAFKKICDILPIATADYLKSIKSNQTNNGVNSESVYDTLLKKSSKNKISILGQMFLDTFDGYNGF